MKQKKLRLFVLLCACLLILAACAEQEDNIVPVPDASAPQHGSDTLPVPDDSDSETENDTMTVPDTSDAEQKEDALPIPEPSLFEYEGETEIIFNEACAYYNGDKQNNQVVLPLVQVLGSYEEDGITKILSCIIKSEFSLDGTDLSVRGDSIFPIVTDIKYTDEGYELVCFNSVEEILANAEISFPDIFILVCGPLKQVEEDIENGTFAIPELNKSDGRKIEYLKWAGVEANTVNKTDSYENYLKMLSLNTYE